MHPRRPTTRVQRPQFNRPRPKQKKAHSKYIGIFSIFLLVAALIVIKFKSSNTSNETFVSASNKSQESQITKKPLKETSILQNQISEILGTDIDHYGIYIKNLKTDQIISINADKSLPPASIYKVPLAMLVLKDIDNGKRNLTDTLLLKPSNKAYATDAMFYFNDNSNYTLKEYLQFMIIQSDNTAMNSLEELLGSAEVVNSRLESELRVNNFFRDPHQASAKEIGQVFEQIYKQSYLSKSSNDFLLDLMKNTAAWMQDRIPAGVKEFDEAVVAHKVGNLVTKSGSEYADAGIVYGPESDFVIVVINEDIIEDEAKIKIQDITRAAYVWHNN
jgi:beta-lactamase class A